jgi:hypothetical protein
MGQYRFLVFTNPVVGREVEFDRWYDDRHIGDVLAIPGFVAAQRHVANLARGTPSHGYLLIYEIETDDIGAVFAELRIRSGTERMPISDALKRSDTMTCVYEVKGERRLA